ncbi:hypothetical protein B488_08070 [Liberibacter crescens BT-1]|uniref:Uncharacterized protein n=1 Tax=Liberibacter crescens (strain BT-1) TaxID=1215343 RepID=L0ETD3_LIBCB|nr:hypothetical protein [Liberibacter crescens]AGA64799.1 hypothetical protein B488_08070 [Liberibacter crescens BT-1]AMC12861.1 hypothetical protein RL73_04075 [Liberibacter crescens]
MADNNITKSLEIFRMNLRQDLNELIDNKVDSLVNKMDTKFDSFSGKVEEKFDKVDVKINSINEKVHCVTDHVNYKICQMENLSYKEIDLIKNELHRSAERDFRMLFGVIITVTLSLAGMIARSLHWF